MIEKCEIASKHKENYLQLSCLAQTIQFWPVSDEKKMPSTPVYDKDSLVPQPTCFQVRWGPCLLPNRKNIITLIKWSYHCQLKQSRSHDVKVIHVQKITMVVTNRANACWRRGTKAKRGVRILSGGPWDISHDMQVLTCICQSSYMYFQCAFMYLSK